MRFEAVIAIRGVNPYVIVSRERAERLLPGSRGPLPVTVRVNGEPDPAWHINMMPTGQGDYYLYLHGDVRRASGTGVGDLVTVDVEHDADYRGGPAQEMFAGLRSALELDQTAGANWANLAPSRQKEVVRYFAMLKSEEARNRNLERVMRVLRGEPERFMGRDWRGGR